MKEDIKILEEIVDIYYDCAGNKEQDYDMRVDMGFMKKEAQALENLIKGYRELHKDNKYLKEHIAMLICLQQENIDLNNELNKLKSKINDKIKELNGDIEYQKQYGNTAKREKLEFEKEIYIELLEV